MSEPKPQQAPKEIVSKDTPVARRRFLIVNPTEFIGFFTKGFVFAKRIKLIEGVPEDAQVVSMTVDHIRNGLVFLVESAEYDEIPMTQMPPVQHISIELGVQNATKKKSSARKK